MYILDLASGRAHRVSDSPRGAYGPRWAPDGVSITWAEGWSRVLFARADGVVRTAAPTGANATPTWAADSRRIIWSRFSHGAGFEVVVTEADTGAETVLPTERANSIFAPSRSGEYIAYGWSTQGEPLRVIRIDGTGDTVVPDSKAHRTPAWSPDNRTLAYTGSFPGIVGYDVATGETRILYRETPSLAFAFAGTDRLLVNTDTGIDVVDLTTGTVTATIKGGVDPVWDSAREMVVFRRMTKEPYADVFEARLDGSGERRLLVGDGAQVLSLDPSPTGGRLAFHCSALNSA
jgi:Tol biopolymer transport system component